MTTKPEVFISYKWGGESEKIAQQVKCVLEKPKKYSVIIDKQDIKYRDNIIDFERRIGDSKYIVAIISDGYLKSENCMYEMLCIYYKGNFEKRIFPIVLEGETIYNEINRKALVKHWIKKVKQLSNQHSSNHTTIDYTIAERINLYRKIELEIGTITAKLKPIKNLASTAENLFDYQELVSMLDQQVRINTQQPSHAFANLLPYLGNRQSQKEELREYMLHHFPLKPYRPLLAFVYSPYNECPDRLIERFRMETLREFAHFANDECLDDEKSITWPSLEPSKNIGRRYQNYLCELAIKVGSDQSDINGLYTALVTHPSKTICIRHNLSLSSWHNSDAELVLRAVALWNEICGRISQKRIFIFFCFKNFSIKKKWPWEKETAKKIMCFIEGFSFGLYKNIHGLCFTPLEPVKKEWLDEYIDNYGKNIAGSKEKILLLIEKIYSKYNGKPIPMLKLGEHINEFSMDSSYLDTI